MYTNFLQEMSYIGRVCNKRSVLGDNVSLEVKILSTLERCRLLSVRYKEDLLLEFHRHLIRS